MSGGEATRETTEEEEEENARVTFSFNETSREIGMKTQNMWRRSYQRKEMRSSKRNDRSKSPSV
jgi:hypothetical protein